MSTHKPDDDREFDAFLKGDHALSREYHRDTDDAVPDALDAMILRQAAEQAARQQRLNEAMPSSSIRMPWYRQSWFAPASGVAIAVMVTVVMFYPAQVPLQQQPMEQIKMQELAREEAPARKVMQAPAAPATVEADSAAASFAMHDAAENTAGASQRDAAVETGMLEEVPSSPRLEATPSIEAKAMQAAPAPLAMERQWAKREKPAMNPEWDLLKVLEAGDWVAAAAYLERLPQRDDAAIAAAYQRIRAAIAQPVLPEADDLQALYEWLQTHHPEDIAHDGPATSE